MRLTAEQRDSQTVRSESPRSHHTHINEAGAGGVRVSIMERSSDQVYLHG